ncbi:MAG: glycoside hydrolase family 127 protein [Lentisphaeria bacterium]|nr:glycoside hydrolase family 127 protein [Lentisphaeria bacterium]
MKKFTAPELKSVLLKDSVMAPRQKNCYAATIPQCIKQTIDTGRIQAFALNWKEGMPNRPHIFWDSDVAKVLEGMAYALALNPDPALEKIYDEWVDLICSAQQPDGYLNVYFTVVKPEERFKHLSYAHELYCAGHLIEAAVAGYQALGKTKLLDCLCRYADYLCSVFGFEEGKRRGWPGHEEIELALAKLYRLTKKEEYRKLLQYFINDRGTEPNYYEEVEKDPAPRKYAQADVPVREQTAGTGHAVRQIYLCCGMADLAEIDQDESLLAVCERLHDHIVSKQMYLTGGIGSYFFQEKFSVDYDLSNGGLMYAESCAAMGFALFAIRMFNITGNTKYLDTVERCIYNGILSGISLDGNKFFYTNYLEVDENLKPSVVSKERQPWFNCSCCPTSFSRFLPQLGKFIYSVNDEENEITLNIPVSNHATLNLNSKNVKIDIEGNYPYDGKIIIKIVSESEFSLKCRIPGWCRKWNAKLNGEAITNLHIVRQWNAGDVLELNLDMPAEWIYANPRVTTNTGRIAIMRGPVVYALEEIDQTGPVRELILDTKEPLEVIQNHCDLPEGTPVIKGKAVRETFAGEELYHTNPPEYTETEFYAVPYALWQNRGATNMAVWIRRK